MDSRSGSADISEDCGELRRLRRERHRLLLRVSGGRISVAAGLAGTTDRNKCYHLQLLSKSSLHLQLFSSFGRTSVRGKMVDTSKATKRGGNNINITLPLWSLRLTCELRNDGRRVLVQVIHTPSDGVGGHGDPGHDHPAVVRVQGGCQTRQAAVVDHREVAELLDLLPAVQPFLQARRHLRQGLPGANQSINQSINLFHPCSDLLYRVRSSGNSLSRDTQTSMVSVSSSSTRTTRLGDLVPPGCPVWWSS